ncbi:MAG: DUF2206 domain-containing protein [Candidatus Baldrarchaeia archaeon]
MNILNFFRMNDWEIKKFLSIVLSIQLTLCALICAEVIGFKVPMARQIVGFIYLSFIPGLLMLRVLRLHRLDGIEALLFAVGLSVATLMFIGLFTNTVYPLIGISTPISLEPLIISISVFVLALCVLSYLRDRNFAEPRPINLKDAFSTSILFLCLLPFIAVLGTYLTNFHQNNLLLMVLIPTIGVLPVLAMRDVFKERLYPFAIFVIAVSLLYHRSLISGHLWGWDIQLEYYFSKLVLANRYWDSSLYGSTNGMLATVMLAPIYSIVCNLDVVWVFKIVYPTLFSFVPLAMYHLFQKQTTKKISFLACCFFMFVATFYSTMLHLARQQIAELFLALMLMLVVNEGLKKSCRSILLVLFGVSMVVSHYGTAYLFMFILIVNCLLLFLVDIIQPFLEKLHLRESLRFHHESALGLVFTIMFAVVTLTWYMYIAGSHPFETLVHSAQVIFTEFVNPLQSDAFHLVLRETASPLHDVTKVLHYITQFFIIFGLVDLMFMRKYTGKFNKDYSLLSVIFFSIWVASVIIPYYGFDFTRVYHITLIVLSPYFVIGGILLIEALKQHSKRMAKIGIPQTIKVLPVFLFIFLLFNAGWIYEIAKDNPTSVALSSIDYTCFNNQEVTAAKWLHISRGDGSIYADDYRWLLIIGFEGFLHTSECPYTLEQLLKSPSTQIYIFLGSFNVRTYSVYEVSLVGPRIYSREYVNITHIIFENRNLGKIYDNGGAEIFMFWASAYD